MWIDTRINRFTTAIHVCTFNFMFTPFQIHIFTKHILAAMLEPLTLLHLTAFHLTWSDLTSFDFTSLHVASLQFLSLLQFSLTNPHRMNERISIVLNTIMGRLRATCISLQSSTSLFWETSVGTKTSQPQVHTAWTVAHCTEHCYR